MKCSNSFFSTAQMKCVAAFFQIKGESILIQMHGDFLGVWIVHKLVQCLERNLLHPFFFRFPGVQGPFDFEFQTLRSMAVGHFHVNLRSSKTTSVARWSSLCHCWEWVVRFCWTKTRHGQQKPQKWVGDGKDIDINWQWVIAMPKAFHRISSILTCSSCLCQQTLIGLVLFSSSQISKLIGILSKFSTSRRLIFAV